MVQLLQTMYLLLKSLLFGLVFMVGVDFDGVLFTVKVALFDFGVGSTAQQTSDLVAIDFCAGLGLFCGCEEFALCSRRLGMVISRCQRSWLRCQQRW